MCRMAANTPGGRGTVPVLGAHPSQYTTPAAGEKCTSPSGGEPQAAQATRSGMYPDMVSSRSSKTAFSCPRGSLPRSSSVSVFIIRCKYPGWVSPSGISSRHSWQK